MKKVYTKPEINTKAYAQFESVFTDCNKTDFPCYYQEEPFAGDGSSYCKHINLMG